MNAHEKLMDFAKKSNLKKIQSRGTTMYLPEDVAKTYQESRNEGAETVDGKEGQRRLLDAVENNKSIMIEMGDKTIATNKFIEIRENTNKRLTWIFESDEGNSTMQITRRPDRKYKVKINNTKTGSLVQKLVTKRSDVVEYEFEFMLNGLFWYLQKEGKKIEMFSSFKPFLELNNIKNKMRETSVIAM